MKQHEPSETINKLLSWEKLWPDAVGIWNPGESVFLRGHNIFDEFSEEPWMGYLLFALTGRRHTENQIKLFEALWTLGTSFAEPRLWNNRVAAIAATARSSSNLGLVGGIAASESIIYGQQPLLASYNFLKMISNRLADGSDLTELLMARMQEKRTGRPGAGRLREVAKVPGFGRPVADKDERLAPLMRYVERLDFAEGHYLKIAHKIESALIALDSPLRMNVSTFMAALSADQQLTAKEYYHYTLLCFSAGIIACSKDALEKPEGSFFPVRCERIVYEGPPERRWPDG